MHVHFKNRFGRVACHSPGRRVTTSIHHVTCEPCKQTIGYKDAVILNDHGPRRKR